MLALLEKIRAEEVAWLGPLLDALRADELYRLALLTAAADDDAPGVVRRAGPPPGNRANRGRKFLGRVYASSRDGRRFEKCGPALPSPTSGGPVRNS